MSLPFLKFLRDLKEFSIQKNAVLSQIHKINMSFLHEASIAELCTSMHVLQRGLITVNHWTNTETSSDMADNNT